MTISYTCDATLYGTDPKTGQANPPLSAKFKVPAAQECENTIALDLAADKKGYDAARFKVTNPDGTTDPNATGSLIKTGQDPKTKEVMFTTIKEGAPLNQQYGKFGMTLDK